LEKDIKTFILHYFYKEKTPAVAGVFVLIDISANLIRKTFLILRVTSSEQK